MNERSIRERLTAAVLEIFPSHDYHQVGMRGIAQRAGVGYATLFRHYGSKEKLLFAVVQGWLDELAQTSAAALQGVDEVPEKIRRLLATQLEFFGARPAVGRIVFMSLPSQTWMADDSFRQARLARLFLEVIGQGQRGGMLDRGVPPLMLLDLMWGVVARAFTMWVYRGKKGSLAAQSEAWFQLVWRGMATAGARDAAERSAYKKVEGVFLDF
ncbi:MAG: TetR/AcrR family transcriptional regulator [Deltaproteobacteria bacterium]|nr:TetR/AcrR family transcriptional regulator [Deltaproteobacteria bacterium]